MNIPSNIITLLVGIALTLISLWYGQNHGLMPIAASEEAKEVDSIFNLMMTIGTGLFLLVEGIIIYSAIRFRRRKGDTTDGPPIEGNVPLEILWTAIPTVIVFFLAIYSFEIYNNMGGLDPMTSRDVGLHMAHHHGNSSAKSPDGNLVAFDANQQQVALGLGESPIVNPTGEQPLTVNVQAIQYAWIFNYADTGIVSGELHLPVNKPVKLKMTAGDVIHAFWVPELRLKQDVIPGRDSVLVFTPNREGKYPVICAELCGAYHGGMKTVLYVQSEEEYKQWVAENQPTPEENLDEAVAINPAHLSDGEFLAPYAQEMGIASEILEQLNPSTTATDK